MDDPPLGLLLDVDGPIADPGTRTVAQPSILPDLRALLAAGVPVVFNTGRSDAFLRERVIAPLVAGGWPPGARLHAVCEKGAVWGTVGAGGLGDVHVDEALAVPAECAELVEALVAGDAGAAMDVDRTKRSMATVEARTDVPPARYRRAQAVFDADLVAALTARGVGVRLGDRWCPTPRAAARVGWTRPSSPPTWSPWRWARTSAPAGRWSCWPPTARCRAPGTPSATPPATT